MKSYRTIFAAVCMAILSMPANAAPVTTKSGYEYDKNMLANPDALNWNIEQCSHNGITPDVQAKLAKLMNVEPSEVRHEYCRRILTAYAKGAIPYDDYVQFAQGHVMTASIARALRIAGARPARPRPQHEKLSGFHQ
ncbi:hypothetical protein [Rhizobium sp. P44RR-XXIV]|uniref:hypothetical protein n=1 Tax=Rhizobium sp. P44RR-XXIV TaxID=1921145 RepID=UPI00098601D9|nr:hypothetical protein [Rhizobium sp. P44RR-XXIV]TIX90751.1 hypothetical protein BSK43_015975 [Rhizobium sp. P44RR-XXIV]